MSAQVLRLRDHRPVADLTPDEARQLTDRIRASVAELQPLVAMLPPEPRRAKSADRRHVYFIQPVGGGLIKIGVATRPERRLADIQHMSPVRLRIVGVIAGIGQAGEADLHSRFTAIRAWGEWFQPTAELCDYIRQHATPAPVGAR